MQALSIAAAGMTSAQMRFENSARRTATAPLDNLEQEIAARVQAEQDVKANAAVIRAADRMWFVLAPEGTRKRVERWKPGFWKIASAAGVQSALGLGHPIGPAGAGRLTGPR